MARREYQGAASPTTITGSITNSATSLTLTSSTGWPTGSFSFVIDPGLAGEEKVLATSRSGATVTITTRGYDGTTAASHNAGAVIYPVPSAIDFDEANSLVSGITAGTGIAMAGSTSGSTLLKSTAVAGSTTVTIPAVTDTLVAKTTTDVLTNKDLTSGTNTFPTTLATLASPTFTGTVTIPAGAVISAPKINSTYTAKTASYTFASGDEGQLFSMNNAATQQFNIPTDATFNFAVGTEIDMFWTTGAGQPTVGAVTPGTTTVVSTGATSATPKLRVALSGATAKKLAANSWIVFGDIA